MRGLRENVGRLHNRKESMSYTETERKEIAENIREFLKQKKKDKFEISKRGKGEYIVNKEIELTWYDRERLENVARDVEGRIEHFEK